MCEAYNRISKIEKSRLRLVFFKLFLDSVKSHFPYMCRNILFSGHHSPYLYMFHGKFYITIQLYEFSYWWIRLSLCNFLYSQAMEAAQRTVASWWVSAGVGVEGVMVWRSWRWLTWTGPRLVVGRSHPEWCPPEDEEAKRPDALLDCLHVHISPCRGSGVRRTRVWDREEALGRPRWWVLYHNLPDWELYIHFSYFGYFILICIVQTFLATSYHFRAALF